MIEAIDQGKPIKTEYPYAVQAFALGDQLTLVALSGEVVVDYAHPPPERAWRRAAIRSGWRPMPTTSSVISPRFAS